MRMAFAVLLVAGCRQVVGIEDQPPGSGTAQVQACASFSVGSAACDACMTSSCCDEEQQCAGEDAGHCSALVSCFAQCKSGDAACASDCRAQFPGDEAAAALRSCEASHCASKCGVDSCGGYVYASAACAACGTANCCNQARACEEDAECARLTACEQACATDADCIAVCEVARPSSAVDEERALGACTIAHCAASCIESKWECLEHPSPPPQPALLATFFFTDYSSGQRIANLALRMCSLDDFDCHTQPTTPLATTDAYGLASLALPAGFGGYIEVTGTSYGTFLLFLPALASDVQLGPIQLPSIQTVTQDVEDYLKVTQDPDKALVLVVLRDCNFGYAGGVRLSIQPSDGTTPYYFQDTLPSLAATQTDDAAAVAGFFNTSQGDTALVLGATVVENSLTYPPRTILGRAGAISYVLMDASPL